MTDQVDHKALIAKLQQELAEVEARIKELQNNSTKVETDSEAPKFWPFPTYKGKPFTETGMPPKTRQVLETSNYPAGEDAPF